MANAHTTRRFPRRYPVHGGGWQAGTPPTPGDFNLAAPATPTATTPRATATRTAPPISANDQGPPPAAAVQQPVLPNWIWVAIAGVVAGSAWWFMRRTGREDEQPTP